MLDRYAERMESRGAGSRRTARRDLDTFCGGRLHFQHTRRSLSRARDLCVASDAGPKVARLSHIAARAIDVSRERRIGDVHRAPTRRARTYPSKLRSVARARKPSTTP